MSCGIREIINGFKKNLVNKIMFCLLYISTQGTTPQVLEIAKNKSALLERMKEKAFLQCIDHVGRKNYVDTLNESDLTKVFYPSYPNMALRKKSETEIDVLQVEKAVIVEKGYLYNSTREQLEIKPVGTYYVVEAELWKYEELPVRPVEERRMVDTHEKSVQTDGSVTRNYDKVILQLVEAIQKRKID